MSELQECTKEKPMPQGATGRWSHEGASEIGDSDYVAHYKCKDCGKEWSEELPE